MRARTASTWQRRLTAGFIALAAATAVMAFTLGPSAQNASGVDLDQGPDAVGYVADHQQVAQETVLRGRALVIEHGCGGCHGGFDNPDAEGWLAGVMSSAQEFRIGPTCLWEPEDEPCFITRPRNLTPDNTTGVGRFSERQIFNALRYGLRPGETEDVEITSTTPGEGNFPIVPKYLAPPMPWTAWRHMPDEDLWAIAAYLKHGLEPVENLVQDSEGPPDFWGSFFTPEVLGSLPAADFPTAHEVIPADGSADMDQVLRGRQLVVEHACGDCHGGFSNPELDGWLAGVTQDFQVFPMGPCLFNWGDPCYAMRPRNLTPDDETGTGQYSERQLFNAIRHGLRPSSTPDVEITDANFPDEPDYLAIGMPWGELRHMSDDDIWAIAAYLKNALKPVSNAFEDSDKPEAGWAADWEMIQGTYPPPPFPTRNERGGQ
jgi:mono/diheme cytochrome c family protein